jgi:hypothetical protein
MCILCPRLSFFSFFFFSIWLLFLRDQGTWDRWGGKGGFVAHSDEMKYYDLRHDDQMEWENEMK